MTSLDRAKRFLSNKSRAIACTIVPLAGLVIGQTPAKAQQLTALTPGGCSVSAPAGVFGVSIAGDHCADVAQSGPDAGGLLGVKLYTENSSFEPSPITASSGSGGTFGLQILANSGGTSGTVFTGSIPVSWDFSVSTSNGGDFSYLLTYAIDGSPGGSFSIGNLSSFTNTSDSTISGASAISLAAGSVTGYSIELQVEESTNCCASRSLTLNIPTNSLDLAPPSSTPEPGSIFLFGTGFAGLLLRRFRRARR